MSEPAQLTARQSQVLAFIQDRIDAWGYPPTVREIGEHLGIKSTNGVADHLKALKRKGYLTQEEMKSRTLKPTKKKRRRRAVSSRCRKARPSTVKKTGYGGFAPYHR